ncbi:MAG: hypothetical protein ACTSSP_08990 [Candidatus Asgardarchaeia archaeon]
MPELEYENVFRRKELHDMYAAGEIKPLDDLYLIEDAALTIQELTKKVNFNKDYKKKRSQDINDEIKVLENKIDFFKSVIVSTLKSNKEKSVKFPGSCAVSSRNQKGRWRIDDEEEFITILKAAKKAGEDVDDVLEEFVQYNVRKREADKLLDAWQSSGKLDDFLGKAKKDVESVVSKDPPKVTVSLKFFEKEEEAEDEIEDVPIPVKGAEAAGGLDGYDNL